MSTHLGESLSNETDKANASAKVGTVDEENNSSSSVDSNENNLKIDVSDCEAVKQSNGSVEKVNKSSSQSKVASSSATSSDNVS